MGKASSEAPESTRSEPIGDDADEALYLFESEGDVSADSRRGTSRSPVVLTQSRSQCPLAVAGRKVRGQVGIPTTCGRGALHW